MTDIVGRLWGFRHTLRHDGIDYGDYIEQLTYLFFLIGVGVGEAICIDSDSDGR